jgi:hypothetical protein
LVACKAARDKQSQVREKPTDKTSLGSGKIGQNYFLFFLFLKTQTAKI